MKLSKTETKISPGNPGDQNNPYKLSLLPENRKEAKDPKPLTRILSQRPGKSGRCPRSLGLDVLKSCSHGVFH